MTLLEVTLMLVVTTAIVAALAPALSATISDARSARATTDMQNIRDSILNFLADGFTRFTWDGTQVVARRMTLLVGDGDIAEVGLSTDWTSTTTPQNVDFLEEHLVLNSFNGGSAYPTAFAPTWRGAYMNAPIDPDPWGNRYGVNVQWLGGGAGGSNDVVVHSSGPDEAVDTAHTGNPLAAGNDDLIVLVEA
jgi:hypothetical protein